MNRNIVEDYSKKKDLIIPLHMFDICSARFSSHTACMQLDRRNANSDNNNMNDQQFALTVSLPGA